MALYLAGEIEDGAINYRQCFTNPKLAKFQVAVDAMLIADGFADLIVPLV